MSFFERIGFFTIFAAKQFELKMRTKTFYLILILLLPCWAQAETDSNNIKTVLKELDEAIANKHTHHAQYEEELETLKLRLKNTENREEQYRTLGELFQRYLHYQADSALLYVEKRIHLAETQSGGTVPAEVWVNRAEVMGVMGMYNEALDQLAQIDARTLDTRTLDYFYRTACACYGWLADYTPHSEVQRMHRKKSDAYRDSILTVLRPNLDKDIVQAEKWLMQGDPKRCIDTLNGLLDQSPDRRQKAYIHYIISNAYEAQGNADMQIRYLALTAIIDLTSATREYASLQKLALQMFKKGDIGRAYRYLNCSMEDAAACNASLRFLEVAQFYPIIDKAYKVKENRSQKIQKTFLGCVSLLALFLIAAVVWLYRWNKKLSAMRLDLSDTNRQLSMVNAELKETGKIKEAYIAHYLERCVAYLDKLEAYRRSLAKLAMASRLEELFSAIKSEQFIRDERKEFYHNFDKSFLELFPHFITSFNNLLLPEGQVNPKSGELLTTELRIFALIRLGVTDSNQIAHFLGYSLATIYNYRSKIRNRAKGDKERFEEEVMKL